MAVLRSARRVWRRMWLPVLLAAALPLGAADLTAERARFELTLPVADGTLTPGAYLVSGDLTAGGVPLGSFIRIPRLHHPCGKPPCATTVQAEVPFKRVTEAVLRSFIDGAVEAEADTLFRAPGGVVVRRSVLPIVLSPATLGLDAGALSELVKVDAISLDAPSSRLKLRFVFINPFGFPARFAKLEGEVRPGTRNHYRLEEAPGLALPPGETVHEAAIKIAGEDLLIITARKVMQEQYTLSVDGRFTGTLTVEIAGRTVELAMPE